MVRGNPSGTAATARAMAIKSISATGAPLNRPVIRVTRDAISAMAASVRASFVIFSCKGVASSSCCTNPAISPSFVFIPVELTRALHLPCTIWVPAKIISSISLFTGTLSPVSAASSIRSPTISITRASAGIMSPLSSTSMSPGTTSLEGISFNDPSLRTLVTGCTNFLRASIAFSALYSCRNPIIITKRIMPIIAQKLIISWASKAIMAAAASTHTITFASCLINTFKGVTLFFSSSWLGPYLTSLFLASSFDSPVGELSSFKKASSVLILFSWSTKMQNP
ncbi:MAG: hypothetical protein A4E23_00113 [Methanomethylovorans sp. PtaU1.Bin073]|nr:MAG: hypothetical protein A4E23_00113 [Methanomethylovorans sp. PtaU1.Bin073]